MREWKRPFGEQVRVRGSDGRRARGRAAAGDSRSTRPRGDGERRPARPRVGRRPCRRRTGATSARDAPDSGPTGRPPSRRSRPLAVRPWGRPILEARSLATCRAGRTAASEPDASRPRPQPLAHRLRRRRGRPGRGGGDRVGRLVERRLAARQAFRPTRSHTGTPRRPHAVDGPRRHGTPTRQRPRRRPRRRRRPRPPPRRPSTAARSLRAGHRPSRR